MKQLRLSVARAQHPDDATVLFLVDSSAWLLHDVARLKMTTDRIAKVDEPRNRKAPVAPRFAATFFEPSTSDCIWHGWRSSSAVVELLAEACAWQLSS